MWRELADAGSGIGPVILSAVTAIAGLAAGIEVSALVGFAAAGALWAWIPKGAGRLRAGTASDALAAEAAEATKDAEPPPHAERSAGT